ncbi:MAG TPA: hypothetical protein VFS00_13850, partial [Polyangiaceae bacterium]|nr:hypothetical protein [Polyangiaceae bacterium]
MSDHWVVVPISQDRPTFVNGKRVYVRTPLGPEDRVQVGPWLLRIGVEGDDEWHQKLRFATLHTQPEVPGLAKGAPAKPDRLVVLSGPVPTKEIRLDEGPVRLGPVKGSSLVPEPGALADLNVEVSPLPDGSYELVCHGDGGTVSVNGVPERRVVLAPGDRLRLGSGSGEAYLMFAGRGGDPAGRGAEAAKKADGGASERGLPPLAAFSRADSAGGLRRSDPVALGSQSAPEGEAAWSLQAMGLGGEPASTPRLGPPQPYDAPAGDEEAIEPGPASEPVAGGELLRGRVSRATATLFVVTTLLLGLFVLGVTSLVRGRRPEPEGAADESAATSAPTSKGAQALRAEGEGAERAGGATARRPLAGDAARAG